MGVVRLAAFNFWFLLMAPIVAYSFAWSNHFFIGGNKPSTFGHPFWSLRSDFQMYFLFSIGKLKGELQRAEVIK
ncbi:DUF962 domain-containing protein [Bacillaceae bacterium S4-13-56]